MSTDPASASEGIQSIAATMAADATIERRESISQRSENSQTAADFIRDQMQLEADAREALPYSIENCTKQLGSLRQNVFACLTCNPPPVDLNHDTYNPAGVCYSCSVQCHGEHELVEIFQKRNFTCDCGTTRFTSHQPCSLRISADTNTKGGVHSESADTNNKYNQNFRNRFCSCSIDYRPHEQKGTMFQCLGLGTHETGGCGEDWYHPGCLVGLGPKWYEKQNGKSLLATATATANAALPSISEDSVLHEGGAPEQAVDGIHAGDVGDDDAPLPVGFPEEDDFEHLICYKCIEAYPWIKQYAGSPGFLPPVYFQEADGSINPKKRKVDDGDDEGAPGQPKRVRKEELEDGSVASTPPNLDPIEQVPIKVDGEETKENVLNPVVICKLDSLPPAPPGQFSLFVKSGFRERFCRCPKCFPDLKSHPQLLDEEDAYEPPLSDGASDSGSTHGSGSLYERGESALRNVDRVRAIEGVMAYNHLKDQLKPFFQQFAESGKAISADDIKEYFAKLRGDQEAIKDAGEAAKEDHRQEQSGY